MRIVMRGLADGDGQVLAGALNGRKVLAKLVEQTPDATVKQLHQQFNMPVSVSTVVRALNDMKLTFKKSRFTPANRIGRT